jgi:hypothetical protein
MENTENTTADIGNYELPICGITGKPLPWNKRLWISTYIDGKLEQIPLYLDKDEVRALHRQSPTYKAKKAESSDTSVSDTNTDTEVEEVTMDSLS